MADGCLTICHFINIFIMLSSKFSIFIVLLNIFTHCYSQNLLLNGSADSMFSCPTNLGQLDSAYFWSNPSINSPDLFSKCGLGIAQSPNTGRGFQSPRTGESCAGFGFWYSPVWLNSWNISKEYIKIKLSSTLIQNTNYIFRCYLSYSERILLNTNHVAIDSLGVLFLFDDTTFNFSGNINIAPNIWDTTGYYVDTINWVKISGDYIASGGEKYIIIGDFKNLEITHNYYITKYIGLNAAFNAYYFIDDVAIWPADTIPPPADAGQDTTICRGGKARLGSHSYSDYIYEWWPAASLSNDSGGVVWASPQNTTTYYLQATDDIYTKTVDSVTVFVNNCGQNDTTVCVEQAFAMGSSNNPSWQYQWSPSTYLSSDTIASPQCTPLANQLYHLLITNAVGDTIALDSTHITVGSCYNASAGLDSLLCKGDSLQIGMQQHSFLNYSWSPNFMISDTSIGNPVVWPDTSTLYVLQLEDTLGRITYDTIWVGVKLCQGFEELKNKSKSIVIQPNPAKESIQIRFVGSNLTSQVYSLQIMNLVGELLQEVSIKSSQSINISSLASGTYILRIISEKGVVQVEKLVKL